MFVHYSRKALPESPFVTAHDKLFRPSDKKYSYKEREEEHDDKGRYHSNII